MPRLPKAQRLPDSSFSEPSEPSQIRPEDKPARALRGEQEENPQLVAHMRGKQSTDAHAARGGRGGGAHREQRGKERHPMDIRDTRAEAERVDEQKRKDVAEGFGVGRSKL